MEKLLRDADIIVADPLYRPICPKQSQFYELPHIAFSGRIFLKDIKRKYMKNWKKIMAGLCTAAMISSMVVPVWAAEAETEEIAE